MSPASVAERSNERRLPVGLNSLGPHIVSYTAGLYPATALSASGGNGGVIPKTYFSMNSIEAA